MVFSYVYSPHQYDDYQIGLYVNRNLSHKWVTGEDISYHNFNPNEPFIGNEFNSDTFAAYGENSFTIKFLVKYSRNICFGEVTGFHI